jgi:hypothetical protein
MTVKKTVKVGKKKVMLVVPPKKASSSAPKRKRAKGSMKGWGGIAGSALGGYLGGPGGSAIGGTIGRAAGALVSKITGFGDYKVNKNSIVSGNSVPTFRNDADGMVVCHREFLYNVVGSVGFNLTSIAINPGLVTSFPLLSRLSTIFEEYEMVGLVAEYRPSSGSAVSSVSSALGVVILATDYDAANPLFSNKQQMESYEYATSTVPFTGCLHPIECARNRNVLDNLYVRTSSPPVGTDVRLYDMGNFQIATEGMQSVYTVGELWFSYDVRLRKPRLPPPIENRTPYMRVITQPASTGTDQLLFGTLIPPVVTSDSNLEYFAFSAINRQFTLVLQQPGVYHFRFATKAQNGNPAPSYAGAIGSNLSFGPNILVGNTQSTWTQTNSSGGQWFVSYDQILTVSSAGSGAANEYTLTVTLGIFWIAGNCDLIVTYLGPSVPLSVTENLFEERPVVFALESLVHPLKCEELKGGTESESDGEDVIGVTTKFDALFVEKHRCADASSTGMAERKRLTRL